MSAVASRVGRAARRGWDRAKRWIATEHLHGPRRVVLSDTEAMVVLLARDAGYFVRKFINHHLALGAVHILVIDNGSLDDTLDICRSYKRVTVLRNRLPAKIHESALRSELAQRVVRGGWLLFADSDELVELPFDGPEALTKLTRYCNGHGYTAVLGQMLDRFSLKPYEELQDLDYDEAVRELTHYSLDHLEALSYQDSEGIAFNWFLRDNRCEDPCVSFRVGGLRTEMFGEHPFLSKHSLVRNRPGLVPMSHPHCASGVAVADVTLLLNHYKLAGHWMERDRRSVREAHWTHGEDVRRVHAISTAAGYRLAPASPRGWRGVDALRDEGFLYASPAFRNAMTA